MSLNLKKYLRYCGSSISSLKLRKISGEITSILGSLAVDSSQPIKIGQVSKNPTELDRSKLDNSN